jgi:hypothetical protein
MGKSTRLSARNMRFCVLLATAWLVAATAQAQLRIVTYNTTGAPDSGMDIVLRSIGELSLNGIAKPIDVLLLQEQSNPSPGANSPSPNTQAFVSLLNSMYAGQGVTYDMSDRTGFGDATQTLVYRTETVQLEGDTTVGTTSGSGQPRQALRFELRPVGYDASADFYIYNSHYKASQITSDPDAPARRNVEATAIRSNADALGNGAHIIYAGDHNFYDYTAAVEPAFQTLIAPGNGQAHDPINQVGTWHNNPDFAATHTQSPCEMDCGALVGGGMDDRFDFQLVTGEFLDGEGLSYISGSYRAFGNNGSTFNDAINVGNTVTFPGVQSHSQPAILNALASVTDHIPVVADYQLPARMAAIAGTIPTLNVGQAFQLDVTVSNVANVIAAIGADELDYAITTSGSVTGSFTSQTGILAGSNDVRFFTLDTSTPGPKTGMITVATSSQQAFNSLVQIPVSYTVASSGPQPTVIAKWTFESGPGNPPSGNGTDISGISPATGAGTASGHHASASTAWDNPPGNGSAESFSASRWAIGDYFQFEVSTADLSDISLSVDHTSSNSGPKEWGIQYSTTGIAPFTNTGLTYSVLANASPNPTWNPDTYLSQYTQNIDLSGIPALEDQATLFLRLVSISNVSASGGTVLIGGTSRVDNVTIIGSPIVGITGDHNGDGTVDAADYAAWAKNPSLYDGPQGYIDWAANFGMPAGSGAAAVPEPNVGLLLIFGVCWVALRRVTLKG